MDSLQKYFIQIYNRIFLNKKLNQFKIISKNIFNIDALLNILTN
jgi:hypothetical protein